MSLFTMILLFGSIGLIVVVVAIIAVGWWNNATIENWQFAANRFVEDFPEHTIVSGAVSDDQRTALLEVRHGLMANVGLVTVIGDKWTTRLLTHREAKVEQCNEGLRIQTDDVTFGNLKVLLTHNVAKQWQHKFDQSKSST